MTAPARLLALRLQGFKSFAERTVLEFGPGISAVVGPNGSGKSNLADALRWALGEQGRALRSRKSEDVIFAGSERRAALGMADVSLVFDNTDGLLPVAFSVVELGRRLYRSGENEYLLNRQRVRLRDLVDLLDAAHLADNAFLFIGQGMVDQALALRPEERRPLFEEVAGVRRHERRRRKAEEQLLEAELNLARVEDILAELRPQARRLAAQAEQQLARVSVGDELATALVGAAHARWHEAAARHDAAADRLVHSRTDVERFMAALIEAEGAAASISAAMAARGALERVGREGHETARAALTALQLREARLNSDLAAVGRDRARLDDERAAAETDLALRQRELAAPLPGRDAGLDADVQAADRSLAEALEELRALRTAHQAHGDELVAMRRAEAAREAELEAARRRLIEVERRTADERRRAEVSAQRHASLAERLAAARASQLTAVETERIVGAEREAARTVAETAEGSRRAAAERVADLSSRTAGVRARVEHVRARFAEEETRGIARAARRVGGRRVDEGLQVEPTFRAAVEAALGEVARAYLVGREAVAELAGERGMVVLAGTERPSSGAAAIAGGVGPDAFRGRLSLAGGGLLADAIRLDPLGAAGQVLARAGWVPDVDALVALQAAIPDGWLVVSRDGSAVGTPLWIALGKGDTPLERRAELERLQLELARFQTDLTAAEQAARAGTEEAARARAALETARTAESRAAAVRRAAEEAERSVGREAENDAREAAWQLAQAERGEADVARLREALTGLQTAAIKRTAPAVAPTEGQANRRSDPSALDAWEARVSELRARRDRLVGQATEADQVRRQAEGLLARAAAAAAYDEQRIVRAESDARALAERETGLLAERETLTRDMAAAAAREERARADLEALHEVDATDRTRLSIADAAQAAARERLRAGEERARSAEVAELETRLGLDAIREQVLVELASIGEAGVRALRAAAGDAEVTEPVGMATREHETGRMPIPESGWAAGELDEQTPGLNVALTRALLAWQAAPPDVPPAGPGRLATLRRRFHEFGAASPWAVEEHAALRLRLDSLDTQQADLRSAIAQTRVLIAELSTMIADQFQATFRALETAFDGRFRQLFGGGFARLELTDPSDLSTTGVEIVARPPGKKTQALAMLSGGERALTAVALLFAMLEIRPVPFCVLDEVDAALDEANVGRFADALRSLATTTQFIVITHNRGTIEVADALYGVTVGQDSVSRVISLRLDEATAVAERVRHGAVSLDTVAG